LVRKAQKKGILRGYRSFHELFSSGRTATEGTLRCYYLAVQGRAGSVTVGFTATRNISSAVSRNRIKRLLRESWKATGTALQRLAEETNQRIQVVFVYRATPPNKHPHQRTIQASMERTITAVVKKLETSSQ